LTRKRDVFFLAEALLVLWSAAVAQTGPPIATQGSVFGKPETLETGPDNGFLECAKAVLAPDYRNNDTPEAHTNLLQQTNQPGTAVISGHGDTGQICTGGGMQCRGSQTTYMALDNEGLWKPMAQSLKGKFKQLTLLGCDVAADTSGADFISAVARDTGLTVRAPTAFVWCGNNEIVFETGGQWLEATPDKPANPIHPSLLLAQMKEGASYKLKVNGEFMSIPENEISITDFQSETLGEHREFRSFAAGNSLGLIRLIDFSSPFEVKGSPAAIVTAKFQLVINHGEQKIKKRFVVYNDRIVGDVEAPEVFYHTNHELSQRLMMMRK
jgi:hypothetical protein